MPANAEDRARLTPAPPLLHLWVLLTLQGIVTQLPLVRGGLQAMFDALRNVSEPGLALVAVVAAFTTGQLGGILARMAGLALVLAPWVYAASMERRYSLGPLQNRGRVVDEIAAFVGGLAPKMRLSYNVARPNVLAFVYPHGLLSAKLAVFGGLTRLWRRDRALAEAIVSHEVSHYRHRDALVVAAASALPTAIVLVVVGAFVAVGIAFVAAIASAPSVAIDGAGLAEAATALMLLPLGTIAFFLASFAVPVSLFWVAELYADRGALEAGQGDGLARLFAAERERRGAVFTLLSRLSHPPVALRTTALRSGPFVFLAVIAAIVLGGRVLELHLLLINGTLASLVAEVPVRPDAWIKDYLVSRARPLGLTAALLISWPVLIMLLRRNARVGTTGAAAYAGAAALIGAVALLGAWLAPPIATGVRLALDADRLEPGQTLIVSFEGAVGNERDWITVMAAQTPDELYVDWEEPGTLREGQYRIVCPAPGEYEVRYFPALPDGSYGEPSRAPFTVVGEGPAGDACAIEP